MAKSGNVKLAQVGSKLAPSWPKLAPSWLQVGLGLAWVGSSWPGSHLGRLQVGLGLGWVGSSWPGSALGRPKLDGFKLGRGSEVSSFVGTDLQRESKRKLFVGRRKANIKCQ